MNKRNRAVFFDRDGTINYEKHYLNRVEQFQLFKGVIESVQQLKKQGWKIIVGTNQAGIARGYVTMESLGQIHAKMESVFKAQGAAIDAVYFCPHHPDANCLCRKPNPAMILQAQKKFNLDLSSSFVVGDRETDILWGQKLGLKTILVLTGYGRQTLKERPVLADHVARSLPWAVKKILALDKGDF